MLFRHYSRCLRFIVVFVCVAVLAVNHRAAGDSASLRWELDQYITDARVLWGFHGAALVARDGDVIISKGYGMANRPIGDPNTDTTKFFIGSITKQFTAAGILLLEGDGSLKLNDPISRHLENYPKETGRRITIHQLLTHTSGIPDYTTLPHVVMQRNRQFSTSELMSMFDTKPLEFEPGTKFRYSNSGYIVLGAIIEEISGQSYEAFLHRRIFKPLGMLSTGYARREAGLPDRADGYTIDESRRLVDAIRVHFSLLHSAGALYSTVGDMLIWDQALYSETLLDEEEIRMMFAPYGCNYGYGVRIDTLYGQKHVWHKGFLDGFHTTFDRWIDDRLCVVVFSNEDEAPVDKIARGLAAIVLGEPYSRPLRREPVSIDTSLLPDYQGVYETDGGCCHIVTHDRGMLYSQILGEPRYKLLASAVDTFFYEIDNNRTIIFTRDADNRVISCEQKDYGRSEQAAKLVPKAAERVWKFRQEVLLPERILNEYVGSYALYYELEGRGSDFSLEVTRTENGLLIDLDKQDQIEVFPAERDIFYHKIAAFEIRFTRDRSGTVAGCEVSISGSRVSGKKSN